MKSARSLLLLSLVGSILLFSFFAFVPVNAQTSTPVPSRTPTITAVPFSSGYYTATPYQTPSSYICPVGLPSGWGTVTPDPLWLYSCSSCIAGLTSTAYVAPTVVASPTWPLNMWTLTAQALYGTSTPTLTPTATATLTPTPLSVSSHFSKTYGVFYSQFNSDPSLSLMSAPYDNIVCDPLSTGALYCRGPFGWTDNCGTCDYGYHLRITADVNNLFLHWQGTSTIVTNYYGTFYNTGDVTVTYFTGFVDNYPQPNAIDGAPHVSSAGARYFDLYMLIGGVAGTTHDGRLSLMISPSVDLFTPTPYVVPTSTPSGSYCASISSASTGFGYTGIVYGDTACLDLGPLNWSSILPSWMLVGVLPNIPWLAHICFQDIDIGTIQLFGGFIPLTNLAYVMGIVSLVVIAVHK